MREIYFGNKTHSSTHQSISLSMSSKYKLLIFLLLVTGVCLVLREMRPDISVSLPLPTSCLCDKCLKDDDPWVMKHYDTSVEPFLTTDLNVSEESFKWWKNLQTESRSYDVFKATVASLLQMFPSPPHKSSSSNCWTCSVVGNSGNLVGANYGQLIDSHDVVIRMNKGMTKGFEEDVGRKTTHRVMYPESAMDVENDTHLVLFPFKIMDIEWIMKASTTGFYGRRSYAPIIPKIKVNKDLVRVVNPAFMRYVHHSWLEKTGSYPSTGFMTVVLAMHICNEVHVFGFGADSNGNWNHYWEKLWNKNLKTGVHPGKNEYNIIVQLAKTKKIEFYKGH
ncbi:CMP-N-acetylneuraminate-beta-galactosamide-alpha-2,3-sialyltransferase 2-like [Sphaeramia orbicularis]|uniref:CMP-N-acetylneuraminate-beta-galactosamide-alpha-2,3-sialyltransferase 2 n=1 Tax=Sphaeramia orbicularis TaxID=375764 RepID=A0A673AI76_9TELE|nr:CMP-N-acetylneuraminate-beta-galactosamide-alpha-2,3-sialyltransferase 2-like [Sphaeramia orbicularis]